MEPSSSPGSAEEQNCGCCSSFGRPHLKECSRASGHTCISNGDHECKACELLQNCSCKLGDLHPLEGASAIASCNVPISEELTQNKATLNAHVSNIITKHQNPMTDFTGATAGLVSNLEALLGC